MTAGTGQLEALSGELGTLAADVTALRKDVAELSGMVSMLRVFFDAGVSAGRKAERQDAGQPRPRRERPAHLRVVPVPAERVTR